MIERIFAAPMARLREWLQGLAPRERSLVFLATATTLLLVLWLGLIAPLRESLATLDRHIALGLLRGGRDRSWGELFAAYPLKGWHVPVEVVPPCMFDAEGKRLHG